MSVQRPVPPDVVCAADYERHARALLSPGIWAYVAGAAADGITRGRNRQAFDAIRLNGRVLAEMSGATTATSLLGIDLDMPLLLGPVAYQRLAHEDGEIATAIGASAGRAAMCVSTLSSVTVEEVAAHAHTPLLFQLYMQVERDATSRLIARAEAAGCKALVVTVDAPVNGVRNEEQRAGFRLPADVRAVHLDGVQGPLSRAGPGESPVFKGLLDGAPGWADIEWLRGRTRLPILLKGILHPDDAERALSCGVDGLVVSNHGGRTLDTLPASIEALPAIAARVGGRAPVLLDGGVRRGTDILKALALGADAVLIGQPIMHALAVAGPVGVAHLLTILRAELEAAMALTGCARISRIGRGIVMGAT